MPCAYALYEPFKAFLCLPINVDKICIQLAACEKNVRKIRSTQDDGREGESNSIVNQDGICQGYFHPTHTFLRMWIEYSKK